MAASGYSSLSPAHLAASAAKAATRHSSSPAAHAITDLSSTDDGALGMLDPCIRGGFRLVYDRECPFEVRVQEGDKGPEDVGTLEAIRAKVLVSGDARAPAAVRVELSSENDLFFYYYHECSSADFATVQEEYKLMVEFSDYASVLCRSLNSAIKDPHSYLAVFVMHSDGHARLDFIYNMEYKFVELLSANFMRTPDAAVRERISYRYNTVKSKLAMLQARISDVQKIVQAKNPSLLLQLQKHAGAAVAAATHRAASSRAAAASGGDADPSAGGGK